jgi:hypothetical protein
MRKARARKGNPSKGSPVFYSSKNVLQYSTGFSRRITVVQGRVGLCNEFSRIELGPGSQGFSSRLWIASSYEVICELCFSECKLLASVTFDAHTKISRFEGYAFSYSGLTSIHIPSSIEVICEGCFSQCKSLVSVTFDSDTKVSRFDGRAFFGSGLMSIYIPSSVEVICERCFSQCKSLTSATHDPDSKLRPAL